jgi:hydroxymethylbilane synthase
MNNKKIRVASRKSELAMIQARFIAGLLQESGYEPEVIGISTIGDRDKTSNLKDLDEVGFFTKEIDQALIKADADIAVHCQKDVGTERPDVLKRLAILDRRNPQDILLLQKDVLGSSSIVIGSSSPRRKLLLERFFEKYYPETSSKIKFEEIRGNIETRIRKVIDGEYSATCLALAGLQRYLENSENSQELKEMLSKLELVLLPLSEVPGAPGQGALYIEANESFSLFDEVRKVLNNELAESDIESERNILKENGGGCHQPFGVSVQGFENFQVKIISGQNTRGEELSQIAFVERGALEELELDKCKVFCGPEYQNEIFDRERIKYELPKKKYKAYFISKAEALDDNLIKFLKGKKIWCAGLNSWKKLAQLSLNVQGCCESQGLDNFFNVIGSEPFGYNKNEVLVITNAESAGRWQGYDCIATYGLIENSLVIEGLEPKLAEANVFFWSSFLQYQALKGYIQGEATHFCGMGKTYELLKKEGVNNIFTLPNYRIWREWIAEKAESLEFL